MVNTTIRDDSHNIAFCNMGSIDSTTIEFIDICIIYLPRDVTISMSIEIANSLHTGSCHLVEATTVDITFGIVIIIVIRAIIVTGQIENIIIAACYRDWRMFADELVLGFILMDSDMKLFEPHIASYMIISNRFSFLISIFCSSYCHPLFNDTSLQNHWTFLSRRRTIITVIEIIL